MSNDLLLLLLVSTPLSSSSFPPQTEGRKMQPTALLSSSTSPFSSFYTVPKISRIETLFQTRCRHTIAHRSCTNIPLNSFPLCRYTLPPLHSTAAQEVVETSKDESDFIQIGYIYSVHGLQGEVRVKPSTDFPQMRFAKPGRRWLKERTLGKTSIREVELVEGRDHPGQKSWILSFRGFDDVDIAKQLVGSTVLVRKEEDRPVLEEGEVYLPDLVDMRVILKDTGEPVGTVVKIFNNGASDLLQVRLSSDEETDDVAGSSNSGTHVAGSLVWVPFVDEIVPDVDIEKRELHITPPKGLLELNLRSDMRSKKERRQLEWKQRKKAAQHLIAAKKKLSAMEQKHVFDGLRYGTKSQKSLIADEIVGINTKLFQHALQNVEKPSMRWNLSEFISKNSTLLENALNISEDLPTAIETKTQKVGHDMVSAGKVAIILTADSKIPMARVPDPDLGDSESQGNSPNILHLQALLCDDKRFTAAAEERDSIPLIIVSPADEIQSFQKLFSDHSYFAFDTDKVRFIEEEKLPVVSNSLDEHKKHKILLKTPWEILSSPVGSGGIFSLLSSHGILENLAGIGVEYVQVCSLSHRPVVGGPTFLGLVASRGADIGIKNLKNNKDQEEAINLIFSMRFLKKITAQIKKLQFHVVPKQNPHVEMTDNEWVDILPSSPNSYELQCSIYSALNVCSPDKICMMEVSD